MTDDTPTTALRRLACLDEQQVMALTGLRPNNALTRKRDREAFLRPFGLKPVRSSKIEFHEGEVPSLFLFSGDLSSFHEADLVPLALGLDEGRATLLLPDAREDFALRMRFRPVPVPQASATEAAQQGYELARQVRGTLDLPNAPLLDIADIVERSFGIPVRVAPFATKALRAAAVRDAGQGAAAIVVNAATTDPRLARVAIAHELCHLLFDSSGTRLSVTLDELPTGPSSQRAENRARAFSAELLLPRSGLVGELGPPSLVSDEDIGSEQVAKVRKPFGVSRELAIWHLGNHGFISRAVRDHLLKGLRREKARGPHQIQQLGHQVESLARARKSKAMAQTWRNELEGAASLAATRVLGKATELARTAPLDAAVALGKAYDDALDSGNHAFGLALLGHLNPMVLDGDACSGFLGYVKVSCAALGGEWKDSYRAAARRTVDALANVWGWTSEDVADAANGLLG